MMKTTCASTVKMLVQYLLAGASIFSALSVSAASLAKLSNGETVSDQDFRAYIEKRVDLKPLVRNVWGAENALREMLTTRVLVLEGQRLKEPSRTQAELGRFDDAYASAIYQKLATTCVKAEDPAVVRKFYDEHHDVFTVPASVRLARVMLPVSANVDGLAAMPWLMSQAQQVATGAKGFDQVASKAATIYKMETQGDLGWANLTGEVAIMRALAGAKPNEMVGPVREGDFAYLFLVGDKREPRLLKWEEARNSVANRQIAYCREQANKELTNKLFKQYGVVIDADAVSELFKDANRPGTGATGAAKK